MSCCGAWDIKQVPRAVKIRRTFSESVLRIISKEIAFYAHAALSSRLFSEGKICIDGFSFCCSYRICSLFEIVKMEESVMFSRYFSFLHTVTLTGDFWCKNLSLALLHISLGHSCSLVLFERVTGKCYCFCMALSI